MADQSSQENNGIATADNRRSYKLCRSKVPSGRKRPVGRGFLYLE